MKERFTRRIGHPPGPVQHQPGPQIPEVGLAQMPTITDAFRTDTTRRNPAQGDMISNAQVLDSGPEPANNTGALVPEYGRQIDLRITGDTVPVAVTHPRSLHLDQHLARTRSGELDRLDRQRGVHGSKYRGVDLHGP